MLIVDEVQTLEIATLRELLDIQKVAQCVLVICGNHGRLQHNRPAQLADWAFVSFANNETVDVERIRKITDA